MKKVILMSVVASSLMFAGGDIAPVEPMVEEAVVVNDSGFYVGAGFSSNMNVNHIGSDDDIEFDWSGGTFIAGYQVNKYFAAEARYITSFGDGEYSEPGNDDADWDIDASSLGVYAKGMYPIGDFTPYALLGFAETNFDMTGEGGKNWSDTSFGVGIGASYSFTENISVFADYIYNNIGALQDSNSGWDGDIEFTALTFGLLYNF